MIMVSLALIVLFLGLHSRHVLHSGHFLLILLLMLTLGILGRSSDNQFPCPLACLVKG
jgi:hypothetical protein